MFQSTQPVPDVFEPQLLTFVLKALARKDKPEELGVSKFPIFAADPLAFAHRRLSAYMKEASKTFSLKDPKAFKLKEVKTASEMLALDSAGRFDHVAAILARELWFWKTCLKKVHNGWEYDYNDELCSLHPLIKALLRKLEGDVSYDGLTGILELMDIEPLNYNIRRLCPLEQVMPLVVTACAREGVNDAMLTHLNALRKSAEPEPWDWGSEIKEKKVLADQIDGILNPASRKPPPGPIDAGEPWADAARIKISDPGWLALIQHLATADGSTPTQKWQKAARELVEKVSLKTFDATLLEWLDLALQPRTTFLTQECSPTDAIYLEEGKMVDLYSARNERVLKGLAWTIGAMDRAALALGLGNLAERCYKKLYGIGPRSFKVANACLVALTQMSGREAAGQLSRLKSIVKQPTGRKMIDKALSRMADRRGVTVDDVEEQNIPSYGFVDGETERKIGKATLKLALTDRGQLQQSWLEGGKARKSVPASVKTDHADAFKAAKRELADVEGTLSAQRLRVERLFLRKAPWAFPAWREAYHDHPLVQRFSRRLIWTFQTGKSGKPIAAIWDGKRFVDAADKSMKPVDSTQVQLWHPSAAKAAEVQAWRQWLERHEVVQPFKQAHREIYLLTDAERRTATYSNRFAQHILRQHQFRALCEQRGWKHRMMGGFDGGGGFPSVDIPSWNTRVEFWVEVAEESGASESGVAMHLLTDQVRFLDPATGEPRPLAEVPPLLFSEVFRDVDLFVGVSSVGNDPTWNQGPRAGHHRTYWEGYVFGELSATAQTRRGVLETLMPRLTKLAGRWSLIDRFLVIRGQLRTYKIHLGSGNILMEPNDQYLCIVADSAGKRSDSIFLPFEGDTMLSLILSKAFLLAADDKIEDPTIARQINE